MAQEKRMDQGKQMGQEDREVITIDDSDSDSITIDEGRSCPKPTAASNPTQSRVEENLPWPGLPRASAQPRESTVWDSDFSRHPARVSSPFARPNSNPSVYTTQPNSTRLKTQIAPKDYSDRHVGVRESRRCTICTQDGSCCDWGTPCASCYDTGFTCVYRGEAIAPLPPRSTKTADLVKDSESNAVKFMDDREEADDWYLSVSGRRPTSMKSLSAVAEEARADTEAMNLITGNNGSPIPDDIEMQDVESSTTRLVQEAVRDDSDESVDSDTGSVRPVQEEIQDGSDESIDIITGSTRSVQEEVQNDFSGFVDRETDIESSDNGSIVSNRSQESVAQEPEHIAPTNWLPSSFKEVQKLIRTHQANIASHREYIVEAQLASAKLKSKQNIHIDTEKKGVNPFKNMITAKPNALSIQSISSPLLMRVKSRRGDYVGLKTPVTVLGEDKAAHIPEYKSIGRLRSTFLARNVHGLKYVPYNPGIEEKDLDQRRKDLETRFKDHSSEEFRRQRECLELVYQWSGDFDEILEELQLSVHQLWVYASDYSPTNDPQKCPQCQTYCRKRPASILRSATSIEERQRCHWLYDAFMQIPQVGLWHFLSLKPGHTEKYQDTSQKTKNFDDKKEQILCSLCFTHNCLTHGSFVDKEIVVGKAAINDAEEQNNQRQKTTLSVRNHTPPSHICGLFCVGTSFSDTDELQNIVGLDTDGRSFSGVRNEKVKMLVDLGPYRGTELCGEFCFLDRTERGSPPRGRGTGRARGPVSGRDPFELVKPVALSMAKLYSSNIRLPCMIAKVTGCTCVQAFRVLVRGVNKEHHDTEAEREARAQEGLDTRKMSAKAAGYHTGKSSALENRNTWIPCSHKGPCLTSHSGSECACAREQVYCEKSCGCADNCRRRFKGCRCNKSNKKQCFLDDRCECFAANRECDPQLCHDCGVEEVLDPSNKYRDDIREGRCRNSRLQLDLPPRTRTGMSEVQGWGLFLGQDLPANSFIGEYKGENVSASESDRRGAIYAYVSQEYLFNLNKDNQLDGSRFGNKMRFINNSKVKEFINLFPKLMFVNGVTRIGLFTNRAVKAGEELLYDYGYPADLVKGEFWEKHERAIEHNGVVTPIAKPKFRPRMAKNAGDTSGQGDDEQSPVRKGGLVTGKKKRKRQIEDAGIEDDDVDGQIPAPAAIDSSEYEESSPEDGTTSHGSGEDEDEDEDEDDEDESEDELSKVVPARIDRRRGGEAQRRAAQTRFLNKQRARE